MPNEDNVIDVEAEELPDDPDNLPAVIPKPTTGQKGTHEHAEPMRKWSEEWWSAQSPHTQSRRCRAHSSRTGEPCKNLAMQGGTACRYHGGAAKHVKAAARARLENAAELMAKQLLGIALTAESEAVKLAAIKDSLDRAGLRPPAEVVLSQGESKPYEELFDGISSLSREDSRARRGYDASPAAYGTEGNEHLPPTQSDPPNPSDNGDSCARRNLSNPSDDMSDVHYPGASPSAPHGSPPAEGGTVRPPRPCGSDRDGQAGSPVRHVTGDDAIRLANAANRKIGALKAIESPHKRYRRP
jgi:hypothetical protein